MAAGVEVWIELEAGAGAVPAQAEIEMAVAAAVQFAVEEPERPIVFGLQPVLDVNVLLVDDHHIHELNREYRGIDQATDVLSFSQLEGASQFVAAPNGRLLLGDVVISVETARRQASGSLKAELRQLAVHGTLHLLGYDHETDEDEERMNGLAQRALGQGPPRTANE